MLFYSPLKMLCFFDFNSLSFSQKELTLRQSSNNIVFAWKSISLGIQV